MANIQLKVGDKVWVKGSSFGEIVKTFKNKIQVKYLDPVFRDTYGKIVLCSEKEVQFTCKSRCCRCNKFYCDEDSFEGRKVKKGEDVLMWFGSKYDTKLYQFNLKDGWYCYDCLDYIISTKNGVSKGLCDYVGCTDVWGGPVEREKHGKAKRAASC